MPLICDPIQVKEIYDQAVEQGICLANFCTANTLTTEAIFRAAHSFAQAHGLPGVPVVIAATANYPIEPQLQHYTGTANAKLGLRALLADVENYLSEDSPYAGVRVLLHLDHARPGLDDDIIPQVIGKYATIMYDCSMLPIDENIRQVAGFVERYRGRAWVEGAVEEVVQAADSAPRGGLTDPALAERFLRETGAFLIVPYLGTEHRSTAAVAHYNGTVARAIRDRIGSRMVLHGSSSLHDEDLPRLAGDGIVKVNIWSIFERLGGQAVARDVLENLGNLFTSEQLRAFQEVGILGPRVFEEAYQREQCQGSLGPKGWAVGDRRRRDVWQEAVVARMLFYFEQFSYKRWSL
jgi:fructose/tagatose bisphosphate aldolase